jgi:hypothetical protein
VLDVATFLAGPFCGTIMSLYYSSTEAELVEIMPDLRALASAETSAEVRAALIRSANRYAAMAADCRNLARSTMVFESAA